MPYLGQRPSKGDENNFKILDDISSYTLTFDGSDSSVVSAANDTITSLNHRFVQGQRVTYNNGTGGSDIAGLTDGTVYYIIKHDHHNIKLATSASNASNGTAVNITNVGGGASHTINVAFDGVNTKFKATHTNGQKAKITRSAQLVISINGVIQQPHDTATPSTGFGFDLDGTIVLSQAPVAGDVYWAHVLTNNNVTFDISDNDVDNFTGNGSTVSFNLSKTPPDNRNVLVTIDGVVQYPNDPDGTVRAYNVVENVLTFTVAPAADVQIQVRHIGFAGSTSGGGGGVTNFYGRTGSVVLTNSDNVTVNDAAVTGDLTVTGDFTVNGTTTTLDTNLIDVDKIEVTTESTNIAVAVTHNGSGDLVRLYDGSSQVVTVDDEGNITTTGNIGINSYSKSLQVGSIPSAGGDNYVQLSQNAGITSHRGFDTEYGNASILENLSGGTTQHLILGDGTSSNNSNTVFGISIFESSSYHKRLDLSGSGDLRIPAPLSKVALGTTSPTAHLHIGNLLTGIGNTNIMRVTRDDGVLLYGIDYAGAVSDINEVKFVANNKIFVFRNKGSEAESARITNDGKVGINEAYNIGGRLHVQHDALNENILYATRYNDQSNDKPILGITEAQMSGMTSSGLVIGNHNRDIHIGQVYEANATVNTGYNNGIRLTYDGKVGIHTTIPTAKLEILARGDTEKGIRLLDSNSAQSAPYIEVIGKRQDGNVSQGFGGKIHLAKNRTDTKINNNNIIGSVAFGGNHTDGTEANILYTASISAVASDSFDSATDMPTDLIFLTGSTGLSAIGAVNTTTGTEKFRINSDGDLIHTSVNKTLNLVSTQNVVNAGTKIAFFGANRYTTDQEFASIKGLLKNNSGGSTKQRGHLLFTVGRDSHQHIMDDDGRVGIGTTIPTDILDINSSQASAVSDVYIRNHANLGGAALNLFTQGTYSSPVYKAIIGCSDAGGNIRMGAASNHDLLLLTENDAKITIKSGGNVGINETNPSTILHVENDNANASTYYLNTDAAILVQNKNSDATAKTVLKLEGPVGSGDCALVYGSSATNLLISDRQHERLRITSAGDISIGGRDAALANYSDGSNTTTKLAVVKNGAGSGYHEIAHFTAGTDSNDTGAIVRITQFNNDRGMFIKAGRGTSDQAKAIIGLRNSGGNDGNWLTLTQNIDYITCHKSVIIDNGVNLAVGSSSNTHAPLHVKSENTSYGKNAVFGANGWVNHASYHQSDANVTLLGRDLDGNDKGAGVEFCVRNTGDSNWNHGAITFGQDGFLRIFTGGAGTYVSQERLTIDNQGNSKLGINTPNAFTGSAPNHTQRFLGKKCMQGSVTSTVTLTGSGTGTFDLGRLWITDDSSTELFIQVMRNDSTTYQTHYCKAFIQKVRGTGMSQGHIMYQNGAAYSSGSGFRVTDIHSGGYTVGSASHGTVIDVAGGAGGVIYRMVCFYTTLSKNDMY